MACCKFQIAEGAIFLVICVSEYCFKLNIVTLQRRPGLHIIFYKLKKTYLFGADPFKNQTIIIVKCVFI